MYFDKMVHEMVSLKQRCPLIGGVAKGKDHCSAKMDSFNDLMYLHVLLIKYFFGDKI